MDAEAELIQQGNWKELKRHYSAQKGFGWEAAWLSLTRLKDRRAAIDGFKQALRDPNFEQAAYIMLWRLGERPPSGLPVAPTSLRLYDAWLTGEARPLIFFLTSSSENLRFSEQFLDQIFHQQKNVRPTDLDAIDQAESLSSAASFKLGQIWEKRAKKIERAAQHYDSFLEDPWVARVRDEAFRLLFDEELSKRIRYAYAERDGLTLKRLFRALQAKNSKLNEKKVAPVWIEALAQGLRHDSKNLTENLLGYPFWKTMEWSPAAIFTMKSIIFPEADQEAPKFAQVWEEFFRQKNLEFVPIDYEPDSLALWQIAVEIDPQNLSEALLRFPTEERFLFLWSLRQRKMGGSPHQNRWPENERESKVVKDNLKRAFERSTNRLLWFDRLRQCGCSQDFYEFALGEISIPIPWILEDVQSHLIKASKKIRTYLRERLAIVAPNESESHSLKPTQISQALSYLTPSETQSVLLSRYVLTGIPQEILTDDILELFWDAQDKVGSEIFSRWVDTVLEYLQTKKIEARHWKWVERGWELDAKNLETFSPKLSDRESFPWAKYLDEASRHSLDSLVMTCLPMLPDSRLKVYWIEKLLNHSKDLQLKKVIESISDDLVRTKLVSEWEAKHGDPVRALDASFELLELDPVLNNKSLYLNQLLEIFESLPTKEQKEKAFVLETVFVQAKSLGASSADQLDRLRRISDGIGDWDQAWKFAGYQWYLSNDEEKLNFLDSYLDLAFRSRNIDEAQRNLIDHLFYSSRASELNIKVLDQLLDSTSLFRIKHLRPEFLNRAIQIFPVYDKLLKNLATKDVRAASLWDCFYGGDLEQKATSDLDKVQKRRFDLWGLTEVMTNSNELKAYSSYIDPLPYVGEDFKSLDHSYLDEARRILQRTAKQYKIKVKAQIVLHDGEPELFKLWLRTPVIRIRADFFEDLDEELWRAFSTGYLQAYNDCKKGLDDSVALMERFLQGLLLGGAPISKVVKFCVWLGLAESLIQVADLKLGPNQLMRKIPFLNSLIVFYLSDDFQRKAESLGMPLS